MDPSSTFTPDTERPASGVSTSHAEGTHDLTCPSNPSTKSHITAQSISPTQSTSLEFPQSVVTLAIKLEERRSKGLGKFDSDSSPEAKIQVSRAKRSITGCSGSLNGSESDGSQLSLHAPRSDSPTVPITLFLVRDPDNAPSEATAASTADDADDAADASGAEVELAGTLESILERFPSPPGAVIATVEEALSADSGQDWPLSLGAEKILSFSSDKVTQRYLRKDPELGWVEPRSEWSDDEVHNPLKKALETPIAGPVRKATDKFKEIFKAVRSSETSDRNRTWRAAAKTQPLPRAVTEPKPPCSSSNSIYLLDASRKPRTGL